MELFSCTRMHIITHQIPEYLVQKFSMGITQREFAMSFNMS